MLGTITGDDIAIGQVDPALLTGILVVSPNAHLRTQLVARLSGTPWSVRQAASGAEALERIDSASPALVLLDPALPDLRVEDFKEILRVQSPEIELIPVNSRTGQPTMAVPPPSSLSFQVLREIEKGVGLPQQDPAADLAAHTNLPYRASLPEFVGSAPAVGRLCSLVHAVAQRDTTVLITGESGTGKDLVARALHQLSPRRAKPFVVVNCAAIPEALLEAELFGFVKGAFTGAVQSRIGRIHAAQGGTLFLDEIGDLPIGLQSKLLRFLEQGEVQRLGSTDTFHVDVRVVAATNANLKRLTQEKAFREDLFYRLSVFPLELPPLRERMEDLPLLVQHFVSRFCPHHIVISPEALKTLEMHGWPGNVREVRNVIERASILIGAEREIKPEHIVL